MARAKHGGYLFQRAESANWWIRLRSPGKAVVRSLGTPDRRQAEVIALPLIKQHKAALLAGRPQLVFRPYTVTPGEHTTEDGTRVIATEREIIYLKPDGALIRTEPNNPSQELVNLPPGTVAVWGSPFPDQVGRTVKVEKLERPPTPVQNGDDAILETYLKHANVTGYYEREARDVWALYKRLTDSKPLKDATRDDGRKLVAFYEGEGRKSGTIQKRIGWLRATVNLAIVERKECRSWINPFAGIVPKEPKEVRRATRRLPRGDADMKELKRNIGKLGASDQLLLRVLATTGMRLSEAFEIEGEAKEKGCRYVIVGKKTDQSLRRVPLPGALLPSLPDTIKGKLFKGDAADPEGAASKRLNRFLREIGIVDPRIVIHSLRHRAQDKLRAAG